MSELAHGAMLIGALGHAACATTGRRGRLEGAASVVMIMAMTDMALTRLVPPLAWMLVLLGLGVTLGVRLRTARAASGRHTVTLERLQALNRALAFIVGAWAFAVAGAGAAGGSAPHAHSSGLGFVAAIGSMTVFGGWLAVRELRAGTVARRVRLRHAAEAASTTLMLAAMAVPGLVAALG